MASEKTIKQRTGEIDMGEYQITDINVYMNNETGTGTTTIIMQPVDPVLNRRLKYRRAGRMSVRLPIASDLLSHL